MEEPPVHHFAQAKYNLLLERGDYPPESLDLYVQLAFAQNTHEIN